jgi:hypothetical protein
MAKHRAVIVGAGRIGAGYNWHDDEYTHAGAYRALKDRVELVGFVEPDGKRALAALRKWGVPTYEKMPECDIVSVCVQPEQQMDILIKLCDPSTNYPPDGIWCEKPWVSNDPDPDCPWNCHLTGFDTIQVNYLRRGDPVHQKIAREYPGGRLIVHGKDDIHTRCHFDDLAKWWKATLEYHVENGPCRYYYTMGSTYDDLSWAFPNGGVDGGQCMKAMLGNLLDHIEGKAELWSPPT